MSFLARNISFLRKNNGLTQVELSKKLGIKRSLLGAIEEGRSEPRASVLYKLSKFFKISVEDLIENDLTIKNSEELNINTGIDEMGKKIRTHRIIVSEKDLDRELISLIPISARAGYTLGITQPSFIKEMPKFNLPFNEISNFGTYRVFQIAGDSMVPIINPGDYLITEYVDNWRSIKDFQTYVIITQLDGILYKRVRRVRDKIEMISENREYEPFEIFKGEIMEIWKPIGYISFQMKERELHRTNG